MADGRTILCVNAGSATLKCATFALGAGEELHAIDTIEVPAGPDAISDVLASWDRHPDVVAHRIVHGGPQLDQHTVIDDAVLAQLRDVVSFAPLHLPSELAAIDAARRASPDAVQVACFDTTFHRTMPEVARRLPLPEELDEAGVRRFGFHGISCEYIVDTVTPAALGRAVIAHLGSGASVTAIREGRSIDTSMGLTPAGGVIMATRTGDLDPGVLIHLLREHDYDADGLEALVTKESGLLGLSGTTNDMRGLLAARDGGDGAAALAVESFSRSVAKQVAALTAVLGGLDTLVFTGGIGEHAPAIRADVCERLGHLGVRIDRERNEHNNNVISTGDVAVRVVPTNENLAMARHAVRLSGA